MAIYHATMKSFSRGNGDSSVAAAAYRAGFDLLDTSTGLGDVPQILSSAAVWSPIPYPKEIGREETFY
ncbi:hypothetical protein [Xanthomonas nasturtii]|uniref:hypothetical protein n=1 Tax=Xanthomonas nasturtii TaxID=1843581 RepID=UPI00201327B3|nr:hypothetical protein [Xanthomonas nasturtii]MCL1582875.1 hypothetical protein [Xanthomonas nasturtii]